MLPPVSRPPPRPRCRVISRNQLFVAPRKQPPRYRLKLHEDRPYFAPIDIATIRDRVPPLLVPLPRDYPDTTMVTIMENLEYCLRIGIEFVSSRAVINNERGPPLQISFAFFPSFSACPPVQKRKRHRMNVPSLRNNELRKRGDNEETTTSLVLSSRIYTRVTGISVA